MAHYTPLPSYSLDDQKAPLLVSEEGAIALPMEQDGQEQQQNACSRRCSGGVFGRIKARCAARRLAKYGPPCDNAFCHAKARRRRIFRRIIFGLFSLFLITHLFKGAYMAYTLPKHVTCQEITSDEMSVDLALTRKMFVDYSLTAGTTTITQGDIPEGTIRVKVDFDGVPETNTTILCSAQFKKAVGIGAFTTKKHANLATITRTTIIFPQGEKRPEIKFAGKKAAHCVGGLVRKLLKWNKEEIMEKSD
jgi:hypothetical protein